jgi:hypothetical protein
MNRDLVVIGDPPRAYSPAILDMVVMIEYSTLGSAQQMPTYRLLKRRVLDKAHTKKPRGGM